MKMVYYFVPGIIDSVLFYLLYAGILITSGWKLRTRLWGTLFLCGLFLLTVSSFVTTIRKTEFLLSNFNGEPFEGINFRSPSQQKLRLIPAEYLKRTREFFNAYSDVFNAIHLEGQLCLLLGIASLPLLYRYSENSAIDRSQFEVHPIQLMHPILFIVLQILTFNLFWLGWLFLTIHTFREMNVSSQWQSPLRTVVYLFIPVVSLFWIVYLFITFPIQVSRLSRSVKHEQGAYASTACIIIFLITIPMSISCFWMPKMLIASTLISCTVFAYTHSHLRGIYRILLSPPVQEGSASDSTPAISNDPGFAVS